MNHSWWVMANEFLVSSSWWYTRRRWYTSSIIKWSSIGTTSWNNSKSCWFIYVDCYEDPKRYDTKNDYEHANQWYETIYIRGITCKVRLIFICLFIYLLFSIYQQCDQAAIMEESPGEAERRDELLKMHQSLKDALKIIGDINTSTVSSG